MSSRWLTGSRGGRHWILCLLLVVVGVLTVHPGLAQTSSGSWSTVAPMPTGRADLAAATGSGGKIYAVGGENDVDFSYSFNAVEAYNPGTNTWSCSAGEVSPGCSSTTIAPMPTARFSLAAATDSNGKIYAIGGRGNSFQIRNAAEAYTPAASLTLFLRC